MNSTTAPATTPNPIEPILPADSLLNVIIGAVLGAVLTGVVSYFGLARSRRRRAATDASAIRGQIYHLADIAREAGDEAIPPPKPFTPAYPDERLKNFTRGLVLGALAGAAYGLATATRDGASARTHLRETVRDLVGEARAAVADFADWAADEQPTPPEPTVDSLTLREG